MSRAAARDHRRDVERAESGRGLAGVEYPAGKPGDGVDVCPGQRRDAARALKEIEHGPFGAKYPRERTRDDSGSGAGGEQPSIGCAPGNPALAGPRHGIGKGRAGHHAAAPVLDDAFRLESSGNGDGAGDVSIAVLCQRKRGYAFGLGRHRPSATMRSMAPRARSAISWGTVMW